eukprot:s550_g10.t1
MSTTAFPLPVPKCGIFSGGGPGLSKKRLFQLCKARVLHVLVMCLNFLHLGRFPTNQELGRQPNEIQCQIFSRLRSYVAVCGSIREMFPLAPGRSGPQLAASLMHLEAFVEGCSEFKDSYRRSTSSSLYAEDPDLLPAEEFPQLVPYRSLDPSRLKLSGRGHWDMQEHIQGVLWLPFVEPSFLRHGGDVSGAVLPSFEKEDKDANLRLAKLWDVNGRLLALFDSPSFPGCYSKVFQVYKSPERDRQIGDRRLPNAHEFHVNGPSRNLPTGHLLTELHLDVGSETLRGSVTDRRDFYHQSQVSLSRARSNCLSVSFPLDEFRDCSAFDEYLERKLNDSSRKRSRSEWGDQLAACHDALRVEESGEVFPAFKSLFQGDHLGVEFALAGHEGLLVEESVLKEGERLEGHHLVPPGPRWTGLIIDDFFAIGAEKRRSPKEESFAFKALARARAAYQKYDLEGSPEKDVVAEDFFKAAGAEVDSRESTLRQRICLVSSPFAKRFALSALSLRAARLPSITPRLAARLSGNWVSSLLYRRCLTSIVDEFFAVSAGLELPDAPKVVPLKRKCAEELCLLSACVPLMSANVGAPFASHVYASDASNDGGAIVSVSVPERVSRALWHASDKKGKYTRLERSSRASLKKLVHEIELLDDDADELVPVVDPGPYKAPLMKFDFVEICGGAGTISKHATELGLVTAPPLDLSESVHYDLRGLRFLEWIIHMIEDGLFASFLVEPPCTSFSAAAFPSVRSYSQPLGFDRTEAKTLHGNTLAFRTFVLLKVGRRKRVPCGAEQPRRSKMIWTHFWQTLRDLGFKDNIVASCQFGSIHKKEFDFLLYLFDDIERKCPGGHAHVKIEGKWTKGSAVYHPGLGLYLAKAVYRALMRVRRLGNDEVEVFGQESLLVNDLMCSQKWGLEKVWTWKKNKRSHINVLEIFSSVGALSVAASREPDTRVSLVVDSQVARGALSKGRSSAFALQPSLKRSCAVQLAFGLFPVWTFCPTRLNCADDGSRGVETRDAASASFLEFLEFEDLAAVHHVGLKRFSANWVRLVVLALVVSPVSAVDFPAESLPLYGLSLDFLCLAFFAFGLFAVCVFGLGLIQKAWGHFVKLPACLGLSDLRTYFSVLALSVLVGLVRTLPLLAYVSLVACVYVRVLQARDAGHGPALNAAFKELARVPPILRFSRLVGKHPVKIFIFCILGVSPGPRGFGAWAAPGAMFPRNEAERARAASRGPLELPADRVLRKETRSRRLQLFANFRSWLWKQHGVSLSSLMNQRPPDAELISHWLVCYGREMYGAGKSYNQYSETVNCIAMLRPLLRKQLTPAWDFAFSWLSEEPHVHHPALPVSVLLAMMTIALSWGWIYEACVLGLTWAGVLRIGEVLQAFRRDLVLPQDAAPGNAYVLLRIADPKTRGRAARHQAARVDQEDIVRLLIATYGKADGSEKLWPRSAATLRSRFSILLKTLDLPTKKIDGHRPFDLASLRPGGASWMLDVTENSELVRRRGRWLSNKVMEIYLQEIAVATYLQRISPNQREKILNYAQCFESVLVLVLQYLDLAIPPSTWFYLMKPQRAASFSPRKRLASNALNRFLDSAQLLESTGNLTSKAQRAGEFQGQVVSLYQSLQNSGDGVTKAEVVAKQVAREVEKLQHDLHKQQQVLGVYRHQSHKAKEDAKSWKSSEAAVTLDHLWWKIRNKLDQHLDEAEEEVARYRATFKHLQEYEGCKTGLKALFGSYAKSMKRMRKNHHKLHSLWRETSNLIGELSSVIQDGDLFGKFVADEGCDSTLAMQTLKQAAVAFQGMSLLVHRFEVAGMKKPDISTLKMAAQVVKDSYAKALDSCGSHSVAKVNATSLRH